jgi:hypothetical protein
MDRRFLFPAVAATAWAQQTSPAAAEAEKALRERVQQFYQLQQDKKYRQAEAFVADDTKDDYYAAKKPNIQGFTIDRIELLDGNTRAKVTIKAKVLVLMMGAGAQIFEMPTPTTWKIENGQWCWYISEEARNATPFGPMKHAADAPGAPALDTKGQAPGGPEHPDLGALQGQISIDTTSVDLTRHKRDQQVTIKNGLPGPIDLEVGPHAGMIHGLSVKVDRTHLETGESAVIQFHLYGEKKLADVVEVVATPLNRVFDIQVTAK